MNALPIGTNGETKELGMASVLVTGGSGMIGGALLRRLAQFDGCAVQAAVRRPDARLPQSVIPVLWDIPNAIPDANFLCGTEVVVHCAARVHVMDEKAADPLAEFRRINVAGTLALAQMAADAKVKRFIFVSSIKVNGESTSAEQVFFADDTPAPTDYYGVSKWEAEQGLLDIGARTGMEVVIVRPPLVYGPEVRANFASLMRWVARGLPLPFGGVTENRRSLVALDNLIDLLIVCLEHPAAANQIFLVSDGDDLSTRELVFRIGKAIGIPAKLWSVPINILHFGASMIGKANAFQRLCGSLQVDISKTQQLLGWKPVVSVDEGLYQATRGLRR